MNNGEGYLNDCQMVWTKDKHKSNGDKESTLYHGTSSGKTTTGGLTRPGPGFGAPDLTPFSHHQ